jgi:hypothetical protein
MASKTLSVGDARPTFMKVAALREPVSISDWFRAWLPRFLHLVSKANWFGPIQEGFKTKQSFSGYRAIACKSLVAAGDGGTGN